MAQNSTIGSLGTIYFYYQNFTQNHSNLKVENLSDFGCFQSPKVNKNTKNIYYSGLMFIKICRRMIKILYFIHGL